ncbi:hypothetical protein ACTS9U_07150 [Empedobacter falsenii]|uniref:hypothetical protein n=1 Tax=Empedobacter sp. TaxID=1927715 RepID=UPI0028A865E5|nr:hypothetical protein [Empedobacter sp.]
MLKTFYISERFFTIDELEKFKQKFGYAVSEISYSSSIEIDFRKNDEKEFLFKKGYPMILARFFM